MTSTLTSFEKAVQAFWTEWWIPVAVIASSTLQLVLLTTGYLRKSNVLLRITAWNAYNWSDYVATLALGGMVQNAIGDGNKIYAIWAPILLLYLGAPDNISAFALEDNELWLRHGLLMVIHVASASFVVINCARGWQFILLSSCLMLFGPIKYAERTLALRSASNSATVQAVLPIYRFMSLEHLLSLPIRTNCGTKAPPEDRYFYIISGEKQWFHHLINEFPTWYEQSRPDAYVRAAELTSSFVTLEDIMADPVLSNMPEIPRICLAFALFKIYRQRFSGIDMYEWREPKSRRLFLQFSGPIFRHPVREMDILSVLKAELQFMFDSLYTKSAGTAFTKPGVLFRIFTTLLLIASAAMLRQMNTVLLQQELVVKEARHITFLLVTAALFVEMCQLIRLLRSDWTMVWLACAYVQLDSSSLSKHAAKNHTSCRQSLISCKLLFKSLILRCLTRTARSRQDERDRHSQNSIGQYALIDHMSKIKHINNIPFVNGGKNDRYNSHYNKPIGQPWKILHNLLWPCEYETDPNFLQLFKVKVIRDVLHLCRKLSEPVEGPMEEQDFPELLAVHSIIAKRPWRRSFEQYCVYTACNRKRRGSAETVAINWHLATTVCELLDEGDATGRIEVCNSFTGNIDSVENTVKMAKLLSRYAVYLLMQKPEMLPCHADIAKSKACNAQSALCSTLANVSPYNMQLVGSSDYISSADLKVLMQTLIMQSPQMRLTHVLKDVINCQNTTTDNMDVDADVQQVLVKILSMEEIYVNNHKNAGLQIPEDLIPGLMAGKLLMLGIPSREERWRFIWDFWIEKLACLASPNNSRVHLKQLTMGMEGEFLTYIWVLLGHMGFGKRI